MEHVFTLHKLGRNHTFSYFLGPFHLKRAIKWDMPWFTPEKTTWQQWKLVLLSTFLYILSIIIHVGELPSLMDGNLFVGVENITQCVLRFGFLCKLPGICSLSKGKFTKEAMQSLCLQGIPLVMFPELPSKNKDFYVCMPSVINVRLRH